MPLWFLVHGLKPGPKPGSRGWRQASVIRVSDFAGCEALTSGRTADAAAKLPRPPLVARRTGYRQILPAAGASGFSLSPSNPLYGPFLAPRTG